MADRRIARWLRHLRDRIAEPLSRRQRPRRIDPIYRPQADGTFLLYAGPLLVDRDEKQRVLDGEVEFRLSPKSTLIARFSGPRREYEQVSHVGSLDEPPLFLPTSADLTPPAESRLRERPPKTSWVETTNWSLPERVGRLSKAKRFVVHISGPLRIRFPFSVPLREGGHQPQVAFQLAGWNLVLAPHQDDTSEDDFTAVIRATPAHSRPSEENIGRLGERLFALLSLMANREIGIGPICGFDRRGRIVWVEWGARRVRFGRPGVGWCPLDESADVLPTLARGLSQFADDDALEAVVDRAINHLLAADGSEVLDVRIPVACSAVELLGWAVLQREKGFSREAVEDLKASEIAGGALQWAGIPVATPAHFTALADRKKRVGQAGWQGPDVLFSVRNKLVHPPNQLKDPEWPDGEELYEAWLLATWYLELLILRVIGYEGNYWPRLQLPRYASAVEPVPWTSAATAGAGSA